MKTVTIVDPNADTRWDDFVIAHPYGQICHLSGWKTVLEKSFPHMQPYYLTIEDDGAIEASLPLYCVGSLLKPKRLISIPFATLTDPLAQSSADLEILLHQAVRLLATCKATYLDISTVHAATLFKGLPFAESIRYAYHYLPLVDTPDALMHAFHRTCVRQKITRACRCDFRLRKADHVSDISTFYQLYSLTRKRLGLPPQPVRFFESLWDVFSSDGTIEILLAYQDKKPIAGLLLFRFKDRVSAEYLGYDAEYANDGPHHFLFWEAIKSAYHDRYSVFDFGRTALTNEGLMTFKSRWGTRESHLRQFYYPETMFSEKQSNHESFLHRVAQTLCQNTPEVVLRHVGGVCYRILW